MWDYPPTRVKAVTEAVYGHKLIDNYRWLEDSDSREVLQWSEAQNEFTQKILEEQGSVDSYKSELTDLFDFDGFSLPYKTGDYYYWSERKAGTNQPAVYRKVGLDGEPELLLNPNGMRKDDVITITHWDISPRGKYFLYALSEGGTEMSTMYMRDLATGKELEVDTIPFCRHPQTEWLEDESGFFYTKNPKPGTVPKGEENYHHRVYRHEIGRNYEEDTLVFGEDRHKEDAYGLRISDDRTTLILSAGRDWLKNEVWLHDIKTGENKILIKDLPAKFDLRIVRGRAYLWTNYQAEFGRTLMADADDLPGNIEGWQTFIPERDYELVGTGFTKDFVIAMYLKDAHSLVELLDENGKKVGNLELPKYASFDRLSCRHDESEFFYGFNTFLTSFESYRYDPNQKKSLHCRSVDVPIDLDDYVVAQEWYESKDGTRMPMFIVHHKKVKRNGSNPTLLYGYGGFGISLTPGFIRGNLPFVNRGGVYVITNLRGGGEYGHKWHTAGALENKQNTFDDFIAAAEYLIAEKYTNKDKLAIVGGSNGGLLVGACMTQRPKLFKTVKSRATSCS